MVMTIAEPTTYCYFIDAIVVNDVGTDFFYCFYQNLVWVKQSTFFLFLLSFSQKGWFYSLSCFTYFHESFVKIRNFYTFRESVMLVCVLASSLTSAVIKPPSLHKEWLVHKAIQWSFYLAILSFTFIDMNTSEQLFQNLIWIQLLIKLKFIKLISFYEELKSDHFRVEDFHSPIIFIVVVVFLKYSEI